MRERGERILDGDGVSEDIMSEDFGACHPDGDAGYLELFVVFGSRGGGGVDCRGGGIGIDEGFAEIEDADLGKCVLKEFDIVEHEILRIFRRIAKRAGADSDDSLGIRSDVELFRHAWIVPVNAIKMLLGVEPIPINLLRVPQELTNLLRFKQFQARQREYDVS